MMMNIPPFLMSWVWVMIPSGEGVCVQEDLWWVDWGFGGVPEGTDGSDGGLD